MNCDASIETLVNGTATNVRVSDIACHVEVDWVSSKLRSLTDIEKLDVLDSAENEVFRALMEHNLRSVLSFQRFFSTSELDVSGEETDFCSHLKLVIAIGSNIRVMLVFEWLGE
jgi:hypothetical protein